jgi:hypothetical protein
MWQNLLAHDFHGLHGFQSCRDFLSIFHPRLSFFPCGGQMSKILQHKAITQLNIFLKVIPLFPFTISHNFPAI